jgi:hypothetical protein
MPEYLKQVEQEFIDMLRPTYNNFNAKSQDVERYKKWHQSEKGKEANRKYHSQLCSYNGETLTLNTLSARFLKAGTPHPVLEAKKYLLTQQ